MGGLAKQRREAAALAEESLDIPAAGADARRSQFPNFDAISHRHGRRPVIGIVSISPIADDPRVRRQGETFHAMGCEVRAFGESSQISQPPAWRIVSIDEMSSGPSPTVTAPTSWRALLAKVVESASLLWI